MAIASRPRSDYRRRDPRSRGTSTQDGDWIEAQQAVGLTLAVAVMLGGARIEVPHTPSSG